jgi:hypothetical protein
VKIIENSPRKLLNRTNENIEMNIKVLPLILSPSSVLNSLRCFINSVFHVIVCREGLNNIFIEMNIIHKNVLVQFIDIFIIIVVGSNRENRGLNPRSYLLQWYVFHRLQSTFFITTFARECIRSLTIYYINSVAFVLLRMNFETLKSRIVYCLTLPAI